jgi:DNA-binding CsgD family transcriptional regulator
MLMRWSRSRASLRDLADALGFPIVIADLEGQVLHETPALDALLVAESSAALLRTGIADLLTARAREARSPGRADGERPILVPSCCPIRTEHSRYLLRSCIHRAGGAPAVLLVYVERVAPPLRSEADLCETFSLTPTEARVALLLAQGKSNAEIAQALSISPHTARRHTERVLYKLAVRSRAEVAVKLLL